MAKTADRDRETPGNKRLIGLEWVGSKQDVPLSHPLLEGGLPSNDGFWKDNLVSWKKYHTVSLVLNFSLSF